MGHGRGGISSDSCSVRGMIYAVVLLVSGCLDSPHEVAKPPSVTHEPVASRRPTHAGSQGSVAKARPTEGEGLKEGLPSTVGKTASLVESPEVDTMAAGGDSGGRPSRPRWSPPAIDEERARGSGLRKCSSRHLTLYTDLPENAAVDELPAVFDGAVPQWCEYFEIGTDQAAAWHMTAYLMADKDKFRRAGLLPDQLPPFLHGYQRDAELWLHEQPTDYYRRHLLLHEGTHAFMQWSLGACGPPWYMEGVAELLATHRWQDGKATLRYFPKSREETPHWGRIKIIRDDLAANRGKLPEDVMQYDHAAHLNVEPYAWCWALATFFDSDPFTQPKFRELRRFTTGTESQFNEQFRRWIEPEWPRLVRQWKVFVFNVEYGYSLARELIEPKPTQSLPAQGAEVTLAADRGWQSTGIRLDAGTTYRFEASGRFQVADQPKIWWCEPNGVTIRYHRGLPLGILLGAIVDEDDPSRDVTAWIHPDPLGLRRESTVDRSGTLYLRINDSPAELDDNAGELTVHITAVPPAPAAGGTRR